MSKFLSYGGWSCWHEMAIFMRQIDDFKTILAEPRIGTVETAMAPGWMLLHHYSPSVNAVVVRRKTQDVVRSMLAIDLHGVATYDKDRLVKVMDYENRVLDQISASLPNCLNLDFDDLSTRDGCAALFEHCLPFKFDDAWWEKWRNENVQVDVAEYVKYYHANRPEIDGFKKLCWRELRKLRTAGAITKH